MDKDIALAIIGGVTTIVTAIIARNNHVRAKRAEAMYSDVNGERNKIQKQNKRLTASLSCLEIMYDAQFVSFINEKVDYLFQYTKAERFIILFAVNGKDSFNFVSVCYEKTKTEKTRGSIYRYVRLRVDDAYRSMLKQVERDYSVFIDVAKMQPSLLKDIYESSVEGIKYSSVHFIKRLHADEDNDVVVYSSLATTESPNYSVSEQTIIKGVYDQIRDHAKNITLRLDNDGFM